MEPAQKRPPRELLTRNGFVHAHDDGVDHLTVFALVAACAQVAFSRTSCGSARVASRRATPRAERTGLIHESPGDDARERPGRARCPSHPPGPCSGLCQRPGVLTSSSAVTVGESGTEPIGALSISARRPTRARSSSRKRVQSARNSSLTKSPGSSGPRAGGGWGCSVGPGITPHLGVERWISRDLSCPQTPQPWELSAGDVERDSTRSDAAWGPPKGGMPDENRRKEREPHPRERRRANPLGAGRRAERPS
jgi:hypothetical protein